MSISSRQSELFAGADWKVLYRAFQNINFNASDPASINGALISYIQSAYPENFNDYIESSEFIAIIDLLSWLAGTLAFKTDIAVRENFLETAESRESVLRLARFLSYNPARNQCARGILKIVEVSTDDPAVQNSFGTDLANTTIIWNNPDDPNWNEDFNTILNAAFVSTNPYGVPLKQAVIGSNINAELYRINSFAAKNNLNFSGGASGTDMDFEICNGDIDSTGILTERAPNPNNALHVYHLADGNGNGSARTGFFGLFKQGSTRSETFTIASPIENQVLDIASGNVNNTDVWVSTVDDNGAVLTAWTPVPVMLDENITYNSLPINQRNIYQIVTRDNDQISIRFSDGRYGNAPSGNLQVKYRVSNGLTYVINPADINLISIPVSYYNVNGIQQTLMLTFSLFDKITNANSAEAIQDIRTRAPMVYATQNRMVSGEDYNSFPLKTNLAAKLKAVNRVYSGHSRYIDLHDPTGTYQDLSIYAEDGIVFSEPANAYSEIPITLSRTPGEIVESYIQPMLSSIEAINIMRDTFLRASLAGQITFPTGLSWTQSNASLYSSTGYLNHVTALIQQGAMIQLMVAGKPQWVAVAAVAGSITTVPALNTAGPVTLSEPIPTGSLVLAIIPAYYSTLPASVITTIEDKITKHLSFSLNYSFTQTGDAIWQVVTPLINLVPPVVTSSGPAVTVLSCVFLPGLWRLNSLGLRYVFESISTIEWFDDGYRAIDQHTGNASTDLIRVMRINENLNDQNGRGLRRDFDYTIDRLWLYPNGTPEPRRTKVVFADTNDDGFPDDPDTMLRVVSQTVPNSYLFWKTDQYGLVNPVYNVVVYETQAELTGSTPLTLLAPWNASTNTPAIVGGTGILGTYYNVVTPGTTNIDGTASWQVGDLVVFNGTRWVKAPALGQQAFVLSGTSVSTSNAFWVYGTGWVMDASYTYSFARGRGPNVAASWINSAGSIIP